jgi:hypothetical protein
MAGREPPRASRLQDRRSLTGGVLATPILDPELDPIAIPMAVHLHRARWVATHGEDQQLADRFSDLTWRTGDGHVRPHIDLYPPAPTRILRQRHRQIAQRHMILPDAGYEEFPKSGQTRPEQGVEHRPIGRGQRLSRHDQRCALDRREGVDEIVMVLAHPGALKALANIGDLRVELKIEQPDPCLPPPGVAKPRGHRGPPGDYAPNAADQGHLRPGRQQRRRHWLALRPRAVGSIRSSVGMLIPESATEMTTPSPPVECSTPSGWYRHPCNIDQ